MLEYLGTKESPTGSNCGKYVDKWNSSFGLYKAPWCATFASNMVRDGKVLPRTWSPLALDFARGDNIQKYSIKEIQLGMYNPAAGDFLVWDYGGGRGHIDFIEKYKDGYFTIVGGNRSDEVKSIKLSACQARQGKAAFVVKVKGSYKFYEKGIASYYANSLHNKATATGELYDMTQLTAAHSSLPFGTKVKVTNLRNHKNVVVRINDRGPFLNNRVIDLSKAAADSLNLKLGQVTIEKVN